MECRVWGVKYRVQSVECKCGAYSVECKVWSVE